MAGDESQSRQRRVLAGLAMFVLAVALLLIVPGGVVLLVAGIASWLHRVDVATAWSRTLGGIGLIGAGAALAALGWLAVERLAGPAGREETPLRRARKFAAAIGILLALVCLPFAAAIHATTHRPWLG